MSEEWDLPVVVFLDGDPGRSVSLLQLPMVQSRLRIFLNTWPRRLRRTSELLRMISCLRLPSDDLSKKDIEALNAELSDRDSLMVGGKNKST